MFRPAPRRQDRRDSARPVSRPGLVAVFLLVLLAPLALRAEQPEAERAAASAVIETFYDELLAVMQEAETLGFAGRFERLEPAMTASYNLPAMARASVAAAWENFGPEDQAAFVVAFTRMSVSTYAARFDGWSGQSFEVDDVVDGPRDTLLVRTRLVKPDGDAVPLDYLMRNYDGDWRIIDVLLDGRISELAKNRSEYGSVLAREGYDGLMQRIADHIDGLGDS